MEKLNLLYEIVVFGVQVKTFPLGIGETFDELANKIPNGRSRPYYGISWIEKDESITYYAVAAEQFAGEAVLYNYTIMEIESGEYFIVALKDWQSNLDKIKGIFHAMMQSEETDSTKPCIEWYKSHDEMLCMMKAI
jgi:predicted transcriptional regulator YdeE